MPTLSAGVWARESPRDIIEAYRVWKLTEALDLSEEQMPVFFARLRKVEETSAEFKQEEHKALRKIGRLLEEKDAHEADLARALAEYEELRREHRKEAARLRSEAVALLNVRQRCQHAVFEERFRSELREMISRVKEMRGEMSRDRPGERPGGSGRRGR
jgi:molecular chaperone GrpE (heat shock protein)